MSKYISDLDTLRFGFPVAKLRNSNDTSEEILFNLKNEGVKLIIARIDAANLNGINKLEKQGFLIKDIQLIYNYSLKNEIPVISNSKYTYRTSSVDDVGQIADIARQSFWNYGHYFADERLDKKKCLEIYIDWAVRSILNKKIADQVIVSEINGKVVGYLSFKVYSDEYESFAAGVIGAVTPEHRKNGVFQQINIEGLKWAKNIGLQRLENQVLINNFSVNKTYTTLGFYVIRSEITLHYWFS